MSFKSEMITFSDIVYQDCLYIIHGHSCRIYSTYTRKNRED